MNTSIVFGALFFSAFPAAIICYLIWKDSPSGRFLWPAGGFVVGFLGGLLFGIPYVLISLACKKFIK